MRIIAGRFRSRRLRTLAGRRLRPIPDRLRVTLFDILLPRVLGSVFIDAYAGSGAVGLEALSRGAQKVFFLENHPAAVAVIRENLASLGVAELAEVLAEDAVAGLRTLARSGVKADICFLSPPYSAPEEYDRTLGLLGQLEMILPGGVVIAQHAKKQSLAESYGRMHRTRQLTQGSNTLSFYTPE